MYGSRSREEIEEIFEPWIVCLFMVFTFTGTQGATHYTTEVDQKTFIEMVMWDALYQTQSWTLARWRGGLDLTVA